jgi:hypothetical protein
MADQKKALHPAHTVSNIKTHIPITLEMEKGLYSTWAELFKVLARSFRVVDHIIPPKAASTAKDPNFDQEEWDDVDATVLTWIYSTISLDLLHTIIAPDQSAMDAWNRLPDIFQDKKNTRVVYLEDQFTHTELAHFPNVSAYCLKLKSLADQLANVGSPVSDSRLVLQLVKGLTNAYGSVATFIHPTKRPTPFLLSGQVSSYTRGNSSQSSSGKRSR